MKMGIILFLVLGGCFIFYKIKHFKIQEEVNFVYGPFVCGGKSLKIETIYSVNNLEGYGGVACCLSRDNDSQY